MATITREEIEAEALKLNKLLVTEVELNKLPEYLFVSDFLPYFCGDRDISKNPDILPMWFSIAGSASAEVQIIDANGYNLFKVPAMSDTTIINTSKIKGSINFADIIAMAKLYTVSTPVRGENYLNKELAEKFFKLKSKSTIFSENEKRWFEILLRYNKNTGGEGIVESTIKDSGKMSDDEMEF